MFVSLGTPGEENAYMATKLLQTLTSITPHCPLLSASGGVHAAPLLATRSQARQCNHFENASCQARPRQTLLVTGIRYIMTGCGIISTPVVQVAELAAGAYH